METDSKLKYVRVSRNLDLNKPGAVVCGGIESDITPSRLTLKQPDGYSKTEGELSSGIICVISGGTTRERAFLNELERKHSFRTLEVIFLSSGKSEGGLTPRMMLKKYESICKQEQLILPGRTVKLESIDRVYMFTDVDHYESELKEILGGNISQSQPRWIISNPDFEIWIYYCFRDNPHEELSAICDAKPSSRSLLMKTLNGRFNNGGGLDPRKAFEHLEDGIRNSRRHYSEHEGFPALLSTQMHVFAEDILRVLGDEYFFFLNRTRLFRETLRQSK